jgi:hypothetical protein
LGSFEGQLAWRRATQIHQFENRHEIEE